MSDNNQQQGQINIELDEKTAEGIYSNLAIIKAFRLLRIFKLFKDWDAIKDLISTLTKSLKPIINLGVLMLLFNFISSLGNNK